MFNSRKVRITVTLYFGRPPKTPASIVPCMSDLSVSPTSRLYSIFAYVAFNFSKRSRTVFIAFYFSNKMNLVY